MGSNPARLDLDGLVESIRLVDENLTARASRAVNLSLTLRNWLIGAYVAEYELNGSDRATYGEHLLDELARKLHGLMISSCGRRQLYHYLTFYRIYPQIVRTLSTHSRQLLPASIGAAIVGTTSTQLINPPEALVNNLSYSHFELLAAIDDDLKRAFYETECLRGGWSVRELKRQITSLYFERSGLSSDKNKLAELALTSVPNINQHLKAFFEEGGLASERTIKKYLIVQTEGAREVSRDA